MAINDVRLFGQLMQDPKFFIHKGNSTPHKVVLSVKTMSRYINSTDRNRIVYDEIVVMSRAPDTIRSIAKDLRKYDIVYIKGMLCTADITRKQVCGNCGEEYTENGFTCYVHPIKIVKFNSGMTEEEGSILIQDNAEVSNEVILDGAICSDINYIEERHYAYYKLAVKRSFHIIEDDAEKRTDYPAINTYFDQAKNDSIYARRGTRMNIRGAIRVRSVKRNITCPYCQTEDTLDYRVLEVVASNINYTANWEKPPEDEYAEENQEAQESDELNVEANDLPYDKRKSDD